VSKIKTTTNVYVTETELWPDYFVREATDADDHNVIKMDTELFERYRAAHSAFHELRDEVRTAIFKSGVRL
jgi:hypothetical protein